MDGEDDVRPPAGVKGWANPRPWSEVEPAVLSALTAVGGDVPPDREFELTLAYVPYSTLGDANGGDLSWEVMISPSGHTVEAYELADHPAAVFDLVGAGAPPALPTQVVEQWAGWASLLRQVAHAVCRLPQDDAGLDVSVRRCVEAGKTVWQWTVEIPVAGDEWPSSAWSASTPGQALRHALDQADLWLAGQPAGHLLLEEEPPAPHSSAPD